MNIVNDKITEYVNSFYKPLSEELGVLRLRCENNGIPLILKETEVFLKMLLDMNKPSRILEIGTAWGYSAIFFSQALPSAKITTIEKSAEAYEIALNNIAEFGFDDTIDVLFGDGRDVLGSLSEEKNLVGDVEKYDMIFIDASKSHYRAFFDKSELLLSDDGIIVCDNIFMKASVVDDSFDLKHRHKTSIKRMREFIEYIEGREDITASLLTCGDGMAVIKFNDDKKD